VPELVQRFGSTQRQALRVVSLSSSVYFYRSTARDAQALTMRIKEIAHTRVHYGYRRIHVLLKREGYKDNVKRIYRLYREQRLSLRHKRPKRNKAAQARQPKAIADYANQMWSMDFVADNLFDGKKLRMLTVVDCFTRESLAIHVGQSLKGEDVVRVVDAITARRGAPQSIKTENEVSVKANLRSKLSEAAGTTTAASSSARRWTSGLMSTTSHSTSVAPVSRPTMRWWKASMGDYARNASMSTGS
jgi:putative transposase